MGKTKKRQYTLEFKQQAVELANRIGTTKAARQLGVPVGSLHHWIENDRKSGAKKEKAKVNYEEENRRLRKENEELKK